MGSRIGSTKLYSSGGRTVLVFSGNGCPRVNIAGRTAKFRDDFSKGFKTSKALARMIGHV